MGSETEGLQVELDQAILKWRDTWKKGSIEELLKLYSEDVRVMRSGVGLIRGREALRSTMESLNTIGFIDIDFHSDEIGGFGGGDMQADGALAYQRYHEALVREDGSEISMVHGFMIWKRVGSRWLIDMYANCSVTPDVSNTCKLRDSIQRTFNHFSQSWKSQDIVKAVEYFTEDCIFTVNSPPKVYKGRESGISAWLKEEFNEGACHINIMIDRVIPMAEVYVFSQLVYVNCLSISVLSGDGQALKTGCGNAIVKRVGESWQIAEALWNIQST